MFDIILSLFRDISLINNVMLIGFIVSFAIIFWREHKSKDSPILFSDFLVDPKTGKASNTKMGQLLGIAFSSWVVIYFAQKVPTDQIASMFPWIFGTWLTFLVTSTGIKTFIGSKDKTEITTKDDK